MREHLQKTFLQWRKTQVFVGYTGVFSGFSGLRQAKWPLEPLEAQCEMVGKKNSLFCIATPFSGFAQWQPRMKLKLLRVQSVVGWTKWLFWGNHWDLGLGFGLWTEAGLGLDLGLAHNIKMMSHDCSVDQTVFIVMYADILPANFLAVVINVVYCGVDVQVVTQYPLERNTWHYGLAFGLQSKELHWDEVEQTVLLQSFQPHKTKKSGSQWWWT